MITRKDYMKDASNLHHEYYKQFVTNDTKRFILDRVGLDKIKASKDGYLNDIVSHSNGGRGKWIWDYSPINRDLAVEAGEVHKGYNPSDSTCTCVGKACAKMLLEE